MAKKKHDQYRAQFFGKTVRRKDQVYDKAEEAPRPAKAPLQGEEILTGQVLRRTRSFYYVLDDSGQEYECKIKGNLFQESRFNNQVAVGDRVRFRIQEGVDMGMVIEIEERKSFLSRQRVGKEAEQVIAANVDHLILVMSIKEPDFRPNLVFRMVTAANLGNVHPILVMTKADLATEEEIDEALAPLQGLGIQFFITSQEGEERDEELKEILESSVSVLSGQSGVGKSSLLNRLFPDLRLKTGAISEETSKGSHTTVFAEMIPLGEGFVIDTPGIREFGLWGVTKEDLHEHFPRIQDFAGKCHFGNCLHLTEPKCKVREAVEQGELPKKLYEAYQYLAETLHDPR